MVYIQKSKVRALVKGEGMNIARDVNDAVDGVVAAAVREAVGKAKAAGRKTLKGADFGVAIRHDTGEVPPLDVAEEAPEDDVDDVPEAKQNGNPPLAQGQSTDGEGEE